MTLEKILHTKVDEISTSLEVPHREAYFLALDLLSGVLGLSRSSCIVQASDYTLGKEDCDRIESYFSRLLAHEPLQYILGETFFGDLQLSVSKGVLIPRPETEELCTKIEQDFRGKSGLFFLDIGAGSGAISLYLAKHLPQSRGYALEKSKAAHDILLQNLSCYGSKIGSSSVEAIVADLFSMESYVDLLPPLDIVVSNPPYVLQSEREEMALHVLDFEPEEALFAPLEDPLYYYRGILALCEKLAFWKGACLYLEINAKLSQETLALFNTHTLFSKVDLMKDLSQKERFIKASIRG